jgi:hypothetical protein
MIVRLAERRRQAIQLSPESRAFLLAKHGETDAERGEALIESFESSIALDEVIDLYRTEPAILEHLLAAEGPIDRDVVLPDLDAGLGGGLGRPAVRLSAHSRSVRAGLARDPGDRSGRSTRRRPEARRVEIDLPPEHLGEILLHSEEAQAGDMPRLELHQNVHVAVRREVAPYHRPEERQPPDVVLAAEPGCSSWGAWILEPATRSLPAIQRDGPLRPYRRQNRTVTSAMIE